MNHLWRWEEQRKAHRGLWVVSCVSVERSWRPNGVGRVATEISQSLLNLFSDNHWQLSVNW